VKDDSLVDQIEIDWIPTSPSKGPVVRNAASELRMIKDFFDHNRWQTLARFILPGVMHHHQRVAEYSGFRFSSDLDPDEKPFDGVQMYDPIDTIHVGEAAFDRVMSRYFTAIVKGVVDDRRPEQSEPWWPSFVDDVDQLVARANRQ